MKIELFRLVWVNFFPSKEKERLDLEHREYSQFVQVRWHLSSLNWSIVEGHGGPWIAVCIKKYVLYRISERFIFGQNDRLGQLWKHLHLHTCRSGKYTYCNNKTKKGVFQALCKVKHPPSFFNIFLSLKF